MAERRRRRFWSTEEKVEIVAQTRVVGTSVSRVARRYDVNANLVFKWARDPRFCGDLSPVSGSLPVDMTFLAVEALPEVAVNDCPVSSTEQVSPEARGKIRISLTSGHRLELSGTFDVGAVVRLVRGLS